MTIDTNTMVSISDANRNFSKVTKLVNQFGSAVILKNNVPKYVVVEFKEAEAIEEATNEEVLAASDKIMKKNKKEIIIDITGLSEKEINKLFLTK